MNQFLLWHRLRLHSIVNTGVCDMFGNVMHYCRTCQERRQDGTAPHWITGLGGWVQFDDR